MSYDLAHLPVKTLLRPAIDAAAGLARLDERIACSSLGRGLVERAHFADACASLWVDGELVTVEDLVLHSDGHDIRTPTHELTIARDVLRCRRRIASHPPDWVLSQAGLSALRGLVRAAPETKSLPQRPMDAASITAADGWDVENEDALSRELRSLDALLKRTEATLAGATSPTVRHSRERDPFLYDMDWDEDARLEEWLQILHRTADLPPILQAVIALDAWNSLAVLQHAPWLGRLLASALLRQSRLTTAGHLVAFNLGLKTVAVDRRRHADRDVRLLAITQALHAAAEMGLREHDRLALARQVLERKLQGRRTSSRLPALIDLVMARPLVSAAMVGETLGVTQQAARRIVADLGLREMTGRGRFRAWGIL